MKKHLLALALSSLLANSTVFAAGTELPDVAIFATGGTIASTAASETQTTNYKTSLGIGNLVQAVPALKNVADIEEIQILNVGSSNIKQENLLHLAKAINEKLGSTETVGAIVTHGTDTLEETAFFLDLTVKQDKPVIVIGAMRPATAISADGPMNLFEAVTLATDPQAKDRGTLVLLNDRIGSAFYTTKTNSTTVDTFRADEEGYLGAMIGGQARFYYEPAKALNKPYFDVSKTEALPRVDILYGYQDMTPDLLDAAVKAGAKGLVIAGSGNGSIAADTKQRIVELQEQGIPVVRSTRTGSGYVSAKQEGMGAGYYNPQKARILLTLALGQGDSIDTIRGYFEPK